MLEWNYKYGCLTIWKEMKHTIPGRLYYEAEALRVTYNNMLYYSLFVNFFGGKFQLNLYFPSTAKTVRWKVCSKMRTELKNKEQTISRSPRQAYH